MLNRSSINYALLIIRIGLGLAFIMHGYPKFMHYEGFAKALTSHGIPGGEIAAIMAAVAEVAGGALLMLGLLSRYAAFILAFNMGVAVYFHMYSGGSFSPGPNSYSHALELVIVFVAMAIAGAGDLSLDKMLRRNT